MAALRFLVVMGVGVGLAFLANQPPAPLPADAPPAVFSATRARADLTWIAAEPHPTGSAAQERVRARLVARLGELGLTADVQHVDGVATTHRSAPASTMSIDNIVARIPGADPAAPALAIMCHYDSVASSPGAADDGAGVATVLEIARALKARGRALPHDLLLVFTDGEEIGLLGAIEFFSGHPLASKIAAVINLEARGGNGRAFLFETGADSDELVRGFARVYRRGTSTSFATFVYDQMPNGTDFTVPKRNGLPGLNFAFIGDPRQYHTMLSTPDALDLGTLQHMGEEALASVELLEASSTYNAPGASLAWSDLFGYKLIVYGRPVGWGIVGGAALLLLIAAVRLVRREGGLHLGAVMRGVLYAVTVAVAGAVLLFLARPIATGTPSHEHYVRLLGVSLRFEAALGCVGIGICVLLARMGARDRDGTRLGVLLLALFGAAVLQAAQPKLAVPVAWPLAVAALGTLALGPSVLASLWITLTAAFATGLCLSWAHGIYLAVAIFTPFAATPFLITTSMAAFPVFSDVANGRLGRSIGALLIGIGFGLALSVRLAG